MENKSKVIIAIQDLIISRNNIMLNIQEVEGEENIKELTKICDEIMMAIAWMKEYNNIQDHELDFDL